MSRARRSPDRRPLPQLRQSGAPGSWQLVEAVELAEACRALEIPITGGNVSLYNETDGRAIYPTPIIGVVGLIRTRRA